MMRPGYLLILLTFLLVGCPEDDPILANRGGSRTPAPSQQDSKVEDSSPSSNPSTKPSTKPTTAPPRTAVKAVHVDPLFVTLYPPAIDLEFGLGLPTRADLGAYAELDGGKQGKVSWVDRSNGALTLTAAGAVSVKLGTAPGTYFVRAQAVDDPNVSQDVAIIVAPHGDLELEIR